MQIHKLQFKWGSKLSFLDSSENIFPFTMTNWISENEV